MKKQVKEAVDYLVKSFGDIRKEATLFVLPPADVAAALAEVKPDTAEYIVLELLAECNPEQKSVTVTVEAAPQNTVTVDTVAAEDMPAA